LAGLAFAQASQKNYGLAAGTSARFFIRTREVTDQPQDVKEREALGGLLSSQDKIAAELAKGDPQALGDLRVLLRRPAMQPGLSTDEA